MADATPIPALYLPAMQTSHMLLAFRSAYLPAGQSAQSEEACADIFPAWQSEQLVAPADAWYSPAAQRMQAEEAISLANVPAEQSAQCEAAGAAAIFPAYMYVCMHVACMHACMYACMYALVLRCMCMHAKDNNLCM